MFCHYCVVTLITLIAYVCYVQHILVTTLCMHDPLRRDTPLYMNVFCDAHNTCTDQAYDAHDHAGVNQHRPIFFNKSFSKAVLQ